MTVFQTSPAMDDISSCSPFHQHVVWSLVPTLHLKAKWHLTQGSLDERQITEKNKQELPMEEGPVKTPVECQADDSKNRQEPVTRARSPTFRTC